MRIYAVTLAAATTLLGGCGTPKESDWYIDKQVLGDSIFFTHYYTTIAEVNTIALRYCQSRGKTATVQSQVRINEMRMSTTYLCR